MTPTLFFLPISQCSFLLLSLMSLLSNSIPLPAHYRKQMGELGKVALSRPTPGFPVTAATHADDLCVSVCVSHTALSVKAHFLALHSFIPTLHLYANTGLHAVTNTHSHTPSMRPTVVSGGKTEDGE